MRRAARPAESGPFVEEWQGYRAQHVPGEAGPRQVRDARRAFYSGAAAAVRQLIEAPTVDAVRRIRAEIAAHAAAEEGDSTPGGCGPEPATMGSESAESASTSSGQPREAPSGTSRWWVVRDEGVGPAGDSVAD